MRVYLRGCMGGCGVAAMSRYSTHGASYECLIARRKTWLPQPLVLCPQE
jgi:hypothetical protein